MKSLEFDDRLGALENENEELRAQIAKLRLDKERLARRRTRIAGFAMAAATRVLLGPGLAESLKSWLRAKSSREPFPVDETADLGAAILRRTIHVGIIGLLVGALPILLLLWQNILIQQQINQQASDNLIVRRAQLLATIYDEECESAKLHPEMGDLVIQDGQSHQSCHPKAPLRARQEATLAFAQIERGRGVRPDLYRADLSGADFRKADLQRVLFTGANLSEANFRQANLRNISLASANLSKADLSEADLSSADLSHTDFREADLSNVNFENTHIWKASFQGADLRMARHLTPFAIHQSRGDSATQLSPSLKRPDHWHSEE